jgi:hypothetical protein
MSSLSFGCNPAARGFFGECRDRGPGPQKAHDRKHSCDGGARGEASISARAQDKKVSDSRNFPQ